MRYVLVVAGFLFSGAAWGGEYYRWVSPPAYPQFRPESRWEPRLEAPPEPEEGFGQVYPRAEYYGGYEGGRVWRRGLEENGR